MNGHFWKVASGLIAAILTLIGGLTLSTAVENSRDIASMQATLYQVEKHLDEQAALQNRISVLEREVSGLLQLERRVNRLEESNK